MAEQAGVKFVDIPAQYADIEEKIISAIAELIHRGAFVGGEALADFEAALARYVGTRFAVGCSDGTSALMLSLLAAGMKPGEAAVVPANTFVATANAVVQAGGEVVVVDCDPRTYLMDLDQLEDVLKTRRARFVMPVHLYGNPCPMRQVTALADRYGAVVIEDNAQAIGAEVDGRKTGSFGLAGCLSFYPSKNLGAFGQGGAVTTGDEQFARRVRMYIEQGQGDSRYHHEVVGYNARLHSIQARVLAMLLEKLDGFNAARRRAAEWYARRLPADRLQKVTEGATCVWHLFEFRCDDKAQRDRLAELFKDAGIGFGFHYPVCVHKQKAYPQLNDLSMPVAERLADTLISLPMHPNLTRQEVDRVCDVIDSL
ncbi:MAG: DegT/DnrJ/EryC1/StrS aminotransferase family protein [Planctomycetes bacterium]|nr:DegT/DnrJ/EryC1/StrS aminotransferase family protein [Planctomycetota bacterium]